MISCVITGGVTALRAGGLTGDASSEERRASARWRCRRERTPSLAPRALRRPELQDAAQAELQLGLAAPLLALDREPVHSHAHVREP